MLRRLLKQIIESSKDFPECRKKILEAYKMRSGGVLMRVSEHSMEELKEIIRN